MSHDLLQEREEAVLSSVIRHYVSTAKPVGSRLISEEMNVSSATIRNVLTGLEDKGFLTHPHTSAGRVPMDRGYRFFVDRLMKARQLSLREKQSIEQDYLRAQDEVETLMRHTAKVLSAMTRLAGLAVFHLPGRVSLDHFKLVAVDPRKVMVIMVLGEGLVKEEWVRLDEPADLKEIAKIGQLLNSRFSGKALSEIRAEMLKEAESLKKARLTIVEKALGLIDKALSFNTEAIHMDGVSRLFEQPEFKTFDRIEKVVRLVEEKQVLARVLGRQWGKKGLLVEIGSEFPESDLKEFSFVHIPYYHGGEVVGVLGVLGPTRMPYERVTGVVHHLARSLERTLSRKGD